MTARKDGLLAKMPSLKTLDAVDDDELSGRRPCPLNKFTIQDVRNLHEILATTDAGAAGQGEAIGEIVAPMSHEEITSHYVNWFGKFPPLGTKLYAAPPAAREDLEQLRHLADECEGLEGLGSAVIAQRIRALIDSAGGAKVDTSTNEHWIKRAQDKLDPQPAADAGDGEDRCPWCNRMQSKNPLSHAPSCRVRTHPDSSWAHDSLRRPAADSEAVAYEAKYATKERLAKPAATEKCDFCGVNPGELHAYDCTALDDTPQPDGGDGSIRKIISETIGFGFEDNELQPVNADDLLRLANALSRPSAEETPVPTL